MAACIQILAKKYCFGWSLFPLWAHNNQRWSAKVRKKTKKKTDVRLTHRPSNHDNLSCTYKDSLLQDEIILVAYATTQGCPWISKYQKSVFLFVGAISSPPLLSPSSLPRGSTTAAAAVSVDKDVGATSPFHIFQCSTWAKLRVIAGQFHHSHLFCLPSICLFSRVSYPYAKQYEFCRGTTLFPMPSHNIWRRHQLFFFFCLFVTSAAEDPLFKGMASLSCYF